jgi:hypothetical protein
MSDDINVQEVVDTSVPATSVEETPIEQVAAPVETPKETPAQMSWRQLREKADKAERERDELARQMQQYSQKPQQKASEEEDDEIRVQPDDLVEGKHLSRYDKKIKKLEAQLHEYQAKTYEATAESRIKQEFPDYDKIVTHESLSILKSQFPELASSISSNPDLYSKAKAAHLAITKLGINPNDTSGQQATIDKNIAKPKPLASIAPQQSDSPLTRANAFASGLTQELKDQLYKEALEAANSR